MVIRPNLSEGVGVPGGRGLGLGFHGDRGEEQFLARQVRSEGAGGREQGGLVRERRVHVLLDERRLKIHLEGQGRAA